MLTETRWNVARRQYTRFEFVLKFDSVSEVNNVQMSETMRVKYEQLFKVWTAFRNTLEDADIMLKTKQIDFMDLLTKEQSDLQIKAKELLQTFSESAPISTEWKSDGKYYRGTFFHSR